MTYQAMARRYRPATFDEVVGQGHVARTLQNAIANERIAHAYLFCGPHGVGKTSMARIFAKALNCTGGPSPTPPPDCPICADIVAGRDPDVHEIDGASNNSVDQVRDLREQASYVPARARYKIYIIDEVHMLSSNAFNALLKTLEEPPAHVKFILATTEPHKLLDTVLSRCQRFDFRLVQPDEIARYLKTLSETSSRSQRVFCQRFDFRLVQPDEIARYLKTLCDREEVSVEPDALEAIASFARGSMRDGLVLLDQLVSYAEGSVTREDVERVRGMAGVESLVAVFDAIVARDPKAALDLAEEINRRGADVGDVLDQLIEYGRDLMQYIVTGSDERLNLYGPARPAVARHAETISLAEALLILDVLAEARTRARSRALSNPFVPLEMALARLAGLEGIEEVGSVLERIETLAESGALAGGAEVRLPPAASPATPSAGEGGAEKKTPEPAPVNESSGAGRAVAEEPPPAPGEDEPAPWEDSADETSAPAPAPTPEPRTRSEAAALPEAAEPSADAVALDLERVEERWRDILGEVGEIYKPDLSYLQPLRPVGAQDGRITLEIPAGRVFLQEGLEERERLERLREAFTRALGMRVGLAFVQGRGAPESAPQSASAGAVQSDPAVRAFMERFGCELMNVEQG